MNHKNNEKYIAKEFLIKSFYKKIKINKFSWNSIGFEGAYELAQGLKALINLNSITINLEYKKNSFSNASKLIKRFKRTK
jgi:hypothetical protein